MIQDMAGEGRRCDDQVLAQCAEGSLSAAEERVAIAHLDGCQRCRLALEQLVATPGEMAELRNFLGDGEEGDEASATHAVQPLANLVRKLLAPSDDDSMLGRLGPYEVAGIVGSGGMGVVLKGWDRTLDRFVAIKVLAPQLATSGAARQRFLREAKAAAAVVHDNVIAIHGVDEFAGLPYLVMPYCRGTTLEKRVRDTGPMSLREILRVGLQTARGLAAAHAQGLVHRDVKPANILLDDGVERVRITDFGLARAADDASLTVTGLLAGTPHYMSPEQALGKPLDARSDLFALGGVLFTLATGKPPFRAESSHAVLRKVTDVEPADVRLANPDLPAWFAGIIRRLLAKDPAARFPSAAEVAGTLEACLAHVNDPLATPLPAGIAHAATLSPIETLPLAPRTPLRTFLDTLRRFMNDQRLLSIAALVLFLMAILLPWPIGGVGRAEPAIAFATIATITSLLFAWLGRGDSLGRFVVKLAGTAAILGVAVVAFWGLSEGRQNAERVAAITAQNLAKQAQMEAIARQSHAPVTIAPMSIPVPNTPRVASGPDPMPIMDWPTPPAALPPVATMMRPSPADTPQELLPPTVTAPSDSGALPLLPNTTPPLPEAPIPPQTGTAQPSDPPSHQLAGDATAELADSLERLDRWLAENPQEVVADVTVRHAGNQVSERMTIGPGRKFPSDYTLNWDQKEFTTGFVGRSLAEVIRAGGRPASQTSAATEISVQTRLEDGDGFQQEMYISGDPKTGAITTKELRARVTLDGAFRTLVRTRVDDFVEVAPGIRLPHRIDIDTFDIDPNQPENVMPKKANSLTIVVEEWRPLGDAVPATSDASEAENARSEMSAGERTPGSSTPDEPADSTPDTSVAPPDAAASLDDLKGVWELIRPAGSGPAGGGEPEAPIRIAFSESLYGYYIGDTSHSVSSLTVDPHASPKRLSFTDNQGTPTHGIYDVEGDGLRLSIAPASEPLPTRFGTEHPEFIRVTKEHPELLERLPGLSPGTRF